MLELILIITISLDVYYTKKNTEHIEYKLEKFKYEIIEKLNEMHGEITREIQKNKN